MCDVVWIIAIERYGVGSAEPSVNLDILSAIGARALELARGIADRSSTTRLVLSLSCRDGPLAADLPANAIITEATTQGLLDAIPRLHGDGTLLIYWIGHGIMTDNRRLLLCADSRDLDSLRALDLDSLMRHLRAPHFARQQIGFFDACAQTFPQPTVTDLSGDGNEPTNQFFYFAASAAQVASASTTVPGFSTTVISALLDPERSFPPLPDPLFDYLRSTFAGMNLATRAFPLQWTEGSGNSWSRQGPIDSIEHTELVSYAQAAHCTLSEFVYLWMLGQHCTSREALSKALRENSMTMFLADLEKKASQKVLVQLLSDAWCDLVLAREFEPACLRLGLSWQDWVILYQQITAQDLLEGAAPPDRLIELLLMMLRQARRNRGIDSCIRLLTLAARRALRLNSQQANALLRMLKTHPLLGPRHDLAVAELKPDEGPMFLLIGLVQPSIDAAPVLDRSWLYLAGESEPETGWQPEPTAPTLAGHINELVNAVQMMHPYRQLVIELLAPNDLLCSPRQLLELANADLGVNIWLEKEHAFTIRWHDRMRGNNPDYKQGNWVSKAALSRRSGLDRAPCSWFGDPVDGIVVGIPFPGPTPAARTRNRENFFHAMLTGAPYMCWPREEPVDLIRFKQIVADFMCSSGLSPAAGAGGFVAAAEALRQARTSGDPILRELCLFVDDPTRNPYDLKYRETTMQRTS